MLVAKTPFPIRSPTLTPLFSKRLKSILVVSPTDPTTVSRLSTFGDVHIDRNLASAPEALTKYIEMKRPKVVIAGAELFPDSAIKALSNYGGSIVRRGT